MAPNLLLLEDATFSISRGSVHVEMSGASVSVPVNRLGDVIRALEGIRFIVDGTNPTGSTGPTPATATTRAAHSAPAAATAVSASGLGAAVDAPTSLVDVPTPPRKKRRSRKRVGDALEVWMKKNPGWHSEQELLEVVIANQMTDAHPKRALKIALGKQADERFERDDSGNWRLLGDTAMGTATGATTPARGRKPRPTRAPAARTDRGRRLKAKPAEAETAAATDDEGEGDDDDPSARTVLVKRGQDRKSASLSPGELEARQAASEALDSRRGKRWPDLKQAELDRFKKNLFGLESAKKD
ncbi:MAG: hypothetical protein CVU56_10055 [Deltaproteobacteria bacterium HGW-Deltaproteobacteria-14]|jgi:hypothetical protein|nr:MAG: hypothetical protein CVU56_10055 [Deltaproteobacteria bacterium HGW-Deltaproteobacteria-14]